jgi:hypothetical protein
VGAGLGCLSVIGFKRCSRIEWRWHSRVEAGRMPGTGQRCWRLALRSDVALKGYGCLMHCWCALPGQCVLGCLGVCLVLAVLLRREATAVTSLRVGLLVRCLQQFMLLADESLAWFLLRCSLHTQVHTCYCCSSGPAIAVSQDKIVHPTSGLTRYP